MNYFGDFLKDATVYIPFNTFTSDDPQASATITNLVDADIKVHKDGGTTQIVTDGATVAIDFDAITGNHLITIDTSAHADYSIGSDYQVRIEGTTVDAGTINAWVGYFSIQNRASSLNATALAALEDQYDGTGLSGDDYPSTQSQLSGIANVGSASHKEFTGEVLTTPATTSSGSYTDTKALDSVYMNWDTVSGGFNAELTSNIGAGIPSGIKITGYMNGANDAVRVQMYDYTAADWVTIGTWSGGGSTVNQVLPYDAFTSMVGTGANLGNIRLRLYNDNGVSDTALTSANIYIDQVFVEFSESAVSVLDAVYFDSGASNTGTSSIDGTPGNPVSTEAAVNTLLAARGFHKVEVALESSITFATSHIDEIWTGVHWTCANGSQNLSGSHFIGAVISGTASASADPIDYVSCRFNTCSLPQFHIERSSFHNATITLNEAGSYTIADSHSAFAGASTPIIDTGAAIANVNLTMPNYQQGIEIANLNTAGTDLFSISGVGQIIYSASSSGAVNQRGDWKVTNTGGVTITTDDNTTSVGTTIPALIGTPSVDLATDIATVLTTQMTESYAADGVAPTMAQATLLIQQILSDFVITGTTISIKGLDGTTEKATLTLSDASNPVSATRAT